MSAGKFNFPNAEGKCLAPVERHVRGAGQFDPALQVGHIMPLQIDVSEFTSYSAAVPPVIDGANDDVTSGDLIAVDVDVAGTGAKGLGVVLTFGA